MLKLFLPLVFAMFFFQITNAQKTYVPDDNFEQVLIDKNIDKDGVVNDSVATSDVSSVTFLSIKSKNISDLTGIESFVKLIDLYCDNNNLTNLDLSKNTLLQGLICSDNKLITLNISKNTELLYLDCDSNELTDLDLSNNSKLQTLLADDNSLSDIHFDQHPDLEGIYVESNNLSSIDLSGMPALKDFSASQNSISSIDLSKNILLNYLKIYDNQLTDLDISMNVVLKQINCTSNQLTLFDISNNSTMEGLWCEKNNLTALNLKNNNNALLDGVYAQNNPSLECIQVDDLSNPYDRINWKKDDSAVYAEECQAFLGIEDEALTEGLHLYPNPVSNILSIESKLPITKVEIFNILGQKESDILSDYHSIITNNLSRGIYVVKIFSDKGIAVRKLIKQ